MSRRRGTRLLVCALVMGCVLALCGPTDGRASPLDDLARDVLRIAEQGDVRGGGFAIIEGGTVAISRPFGHADGEGDRPVDAETLFRVGSVSKTVSSLLALSLVEEGIISLDTPVSALLPDAGIDNPWREDAPLRLVHLLEHTGGLPGSSFYAYAQQGENLSPSDYLARMQGRLTLRWPPGRHYSYANAGHTIAARMLEVASGESFDELMQSRLFAPLGMKTASFSTRASSFERLSESFSRDGSTAPSWPMAFRASGALAATLDDMTGLALYLAIEGGSVAESPISVGLLRRMRQGKTSLPARAGYDHAYGLGLFGFAAANRIFQGHWGKTEGFLANVGVLPETGSGFVLLSNTSNRQAMAAMRERIATYLTGDLPPRSPAVLPSSTSGDDLTGLYVPFTHDMALRSWLFAVAQSVFVEREGDSLSLRPLLPLGEKTRLTPVSDHFYSLEGFPVPTHLFLEDDGQTFLFGDGQDTYRKLTSFQSFALTVALPLLLLLSMASLPTAVVILIGWAVGRAGRSLVAMTSCFAAAGATLLALVAVFASFGIVAPLHRLLLLGEPGGAALLLLLLSLLWPAFACLGALLVLRRWRELPLSGRGYGLAMTVGFLAIAIAMMWQNWLPLATWRA